MQRPSLRASTTSIYPLIGLAGLMATSGCAAVPMLNMASSLLKPTQAAQAAMPSPGVPSAGTQGAGTASTGMPSPDIFSALAQRLGITQQNLQGTKTAAAQTGTTQTATTQTATAASQ